MTLNQHGQAIAEAMQQGFIQGLAVPTHPIVVVLNGESKTPWYQSALNHPLFISCFVVMALMAVGHWATIYMCRRAKVSARVPLASLWGTFAMTAAAGSLSFFPPLALWILAAVALYFLIDAIMQKTETNACEAALNKEIQP